MQIRNGAGSIALGYLFSPDFDLKKRNIPQGILASSAALGPLRPALEQLSLLHSVANPFVGHIAAVDYNGAKGGQLTTDYASAMSFAEDLGFSLVSSLSAYEAQHMALLATLLAEVQPSLHIYDGVKAGRETTRVIDVLDRPGLKAAYDSIKKDTGGTEKKHLTVEGKTLQLLKAFNAELGTEYLPFEYAGHSQPVSVLVCFGTVESSLAAQVANAAAKNGSKIGVVSVRVYRPFLEDEFIKAIPTSVKTVGVLGQVASEDAVREPSISSVLFQDVLTALTYASTTAAPETQDLKYSTAQSWTPVSIAAAFQVVLGETILSEDRSSTLDLLDASVQQYSFWTLDDASSSVPNILAQTLAKDSSSNVTMSVTHDNVLQGGVSRTDVRKSPKSLEASYAVEAADTAIVGDVTLLSKIDIISKVKPAGNLILLLPGVKDGDVENKLPAKFQKSVAEQGIRLFLVDVERAEDPSQVDLITQVAFIRVAMPGAENVAITKMAAINDDSETTHKVAKELEKTLREVEVPKSWTEVEISKDEKPLARDVTANNFVPFHKEQIEPPNQLSDWQKAAKGLLFKEAYDTRNSLRPDLPTRTFTVHVKENRRLTPVTYNRNIFHIEFDLGETGLKYDIGEALGVHAENNHDDVMSFIKFYGLNPDEIVEVPNREDQSLYENRTVYQALMQNIDIFGRPGKKFYESLAEFANEDKEKKELLALGGAEGAVEFKRRAEVDTITYADILLEFPSAHPSFHDIVRIVSPMKRREYSIASCQKVTPKSVALMIVVVGWVDPKGRDRFGQATRYLSHLPIGAPVTVSVKPSVMKLPPKSTQPLIMAGLGTGLAPFRAFVQHRALEKAEGKEIGSVLLYMGSRHQREEYCYGEEWEAYQAAGVITLLGRAFSRDQPQKIYIQDRMRESIQDIVKAYIEEDGAFYLCGPTWPVPDVTNVLEEAIALDAKVAGRKVDPHKEIEKLKDEGRYVLEVY
ncbi:putative assimilatory sulfite reductase [Phaeomoniella chlamydospora]|uniref:assimilatory sulfite reductase (NADPH) n=1 Tax=Phaeomoniella chlamydospora TaxID=158046 RepID=A0A0G2FQ20_PHACM|nr:putative assimilatory sulfite reductase [Phaeomoniella chlamydospora]